MGIVLIKHDHTISHLFVNHSFYYINPDLTDDNIKK